MAARRTTKKEKSILGLAALGVIGYLALKNYDSLKIIGGAANEKISNGLTSIAASTITDAAKDGEK